jgi:hypothetical protein
MKSASRWFHYTDRYNNLLSYFRCDSSVSIRNKLKAWLRTNGATIPWRGMRRVSKTSRTPLEIAQPLIGETADAAPGIQRSEREVHH